MKYSVSMQMPEASLMEASPMILKKDDKISSVSKIGDNGSVKEPTKRNTNELQDETESQFTKRVINAKPTGIKGLGFVLRELKKAQMKGMFKDAFKKDAE